MSNFYKISLAALAAAGMAVFGASNSFAEVSISGGVDVGFGQAAEAPAVGDGSSELNTQSQAQIDVSGGAGAVSAKYRLRVREDSRSKAKGDGIDLDGDGTADFNDNTISDLAAVRHHVHWQINEQMGLTFMGRSFGIPGTYPGHLGVGFFDNGYGIGDGTAVGPSGGWENTSGIDFGFNLGNMAVGAAIVTAGPGMWENQTVIPHFTGNFGSISVGFVMGSGSGKSVDMTTFTETSVTSSEMQVGGVFSTDGLKAGLGISSVTKGDESTQSGMELGVHVAGVEFKYFNITTANKAGDDTGGATDIALGYRMDLGNGASLVPAYASITENPPAGTGDSATWMGVQVGTSF